MSHPRISLFLCFLITFAKSVQAQSDNCCSLTATGLANIEEHRDCPIGTSTFDVQDILFAKCDRCPLGTCRVNSECYCPSDFLESAVQNQLCAYSFGQAWPGSVGEEDTTWRSCFLDFDTDDLMTDEACCALTRTRLEALVGNNDLCPTQGTSESAYIRGLSSKCNRCPFGTCRVNERCYCPKDFLESDIIQSLCTSSFGVRWDASVGREDRHIRSCVRPEPSNTTTFDNCCLMPSSELNLRVGTNDRCPQFSTSIFSDLIFLNNECDACPFGTCRVNRRCFCPQDFLDSSSIKGLCSASFGESHPASVGMVDSRCPANPTPSLLGPDPFPVETPPGSGSPQNQGRSSGRVVGIAIGIVAALVIVGLMITGVWFFRKKARSNAKAQEPTPREQPVAMEEDHDHGIVLI